MPDFRNGRDHLRNNFANTTYGQNIFSIPTSTHYYGLHLIAQNICDRTKILEEGLLSSLDIVELILFIESLRGDEVDVDALEPEVFADIDSLFRNLFTRLSA